MSHLFAVKNLALFTALEDSGVLERLSHCTPMAYPEDSLRRLYLWSPEVMSAVRRAVGRDEVLVRIAYPVSPRAAGFLALCRTLRLEVYGRDKQPLQEPQSLETLSDELSMAIQVELFQELLGAKGVNIPLL